MAVSAPDHTGEVPSFADRLGERFVVAQPSGALLEFLVFHPGFSSAAFFEAAVKGRLKRLSNFRHAAYARATRLQRDPIRGNRLTLVSAYAAGRRLSDVLALARRGKIQPPLGAILSIAKQLMTGAALLHDYAPDVFHGAIGPERLVVGSEGRLVITEYVLGTAVEQAVPEWGVARLWRESRVATLSDASVQRFGRRVDLLQIGVVTLSLLTGRLLNDADFPVKLPDLLDAALEAHGQGDSGALADPLRDWLGKLLCLDPDSAFRSLVEAQKAFGRMVEDETRYGVSPGAVEAFIRQCDEIAPLAIPAPAAPPPEETMAAVSHAPSVAAPESVSIAEPPPEPTPEPPAAPIAETRPAPLPEPPQAPPSEPLPAPSPEPPAPPLEPLPVPTAEPAPTREALPASVHEESAAAPAVPTTAPIPSAPGSSPESIDDAVAEMLAALPKPLMETVLDPFAPWPSSPGPEAGAQREASSSAHPTEEPAAPPAAPAAPQWEVVSNASSSGWPAPHEPSVPSSGAEVAHLQEVAPATAEPERTRTSDHATGERHAAVLSYDEVHRASAPRRAKAPFVWAAVALVVLAVGGVLGGPRIGALLKGGKPTSADPRPAAGPTKPGGFRITTQPPGSLVSIDGTPRGKAPLQVTDLAPGLHSVVVESDWGTLEEAVTVESGKVLPLPLATVGWIKVEAPVELQVSEEGRTYGATGQPLMVPAGRHAFVFSNRSVAVRHRQFVQVPAGQTVKVTLDLPQGVLNLTSDQPAQVLLDGEVLGDAPQVSVPAALGPHQVVFRSVRFGDVSYSVNVTLSAPVSLAANFGARR